MLPGLQWRYEGKASSSAKSTSTKEKKRNKKEMEKEEEEEEEEDAVDLYRTLRFCSRSCTAQQFCARFLPRLSHSSLILWLQNCIVDVGNLIFNVPLHEY